MRRTPRLASGCAVVLLAVAAAGCGGSAKTTAKTPPRTTTTQPTNTSTTAATTVSAATTSGPVRATLHGANHAPVVGKNWVYTVTATDASGHPLSGTVLTEFAFGGQVEGRETPPTHRLKHGHLRDVIQYPADSIGVPLTLETVVRTPAGSVTLGWPIQVKK